MQTTSDAWQPVSSPQSLCNHFTNTCIHVGNSVGFQPRCDCQGGNAIPTYIVVPVLVSCNVWYPSAGLPHSHPIAIATTAIASVRYNDTSKPPSHSEAFSIFIDQGVQHAFEHVNRREMHLFTRWRQFGACVTMTWLSIPMIPLPGDLLTTKLFTTIWGKPSNISQRASSNTVFIMSEKGPHPGPPWYAWTRDVSRQLSRCRENSSSLAVYPQHPRSGKPSNSKTLWLLIAYPTSQSLEIVSDACIVPMAQCMKRSVCPWVLMIWEGPQWHCASRYWPLQMNQAFFASWKEATYIEIKSCFLYRRGW